MVNNTAVKELASLAHKSAQFESHMSNDSSHDESTEVCYFKEKIGGKKMDGPFMWSKGR